MLDRREQRPDSAEAISSTLMETGFRLPGSETHIPFGLDTYKLTKDQHSILCGSLPHLTSAMIKAHRFDQRQRDFVPSQDVPPFIWRFDFLATPPDDINSNSNNLRMVELNATRPGGIWLLTKAQEAHQALGGSNSLWVPTVDAMGEYFSRVAQRGGEGQKRVGLAYTEGYVAEIEMPALAQTLNEWAQETRQNIKFISADRCDFEANERAIYGPDGINVDVFYENAGPKETVDKVETFRFTGTYPETILINPPRIATADNKTLMAHFFNDEFRSQLTPDEIAAIDRFVPPTELVRSRADLETLAQNGLGNYFLKIGDGLRASSGKGVYDGRKVNNTDLYEISVALENGERFVAQARVPPEAPWYPVTSVDDGNIQTKQCFVDFDPYIFYDGENIVVPGALCRAKPTHPVNITQGGALVTPSIV